MRGFKGTAAPPPLCLQEIFSASAVCSPAAAVCSVLLVQLAQRGVLLLQVLISGHDGPVLLLLLLGVGSSLYCS